MFSSCVFPLCSGNREQFVGSGHQTKETRIEADFLWQTALSLRHRRHHTVQRALVGQRGYRTPHPSIQYYFCTNNYNSFKNDNGHGCRESPEQGSLSVVGRVWTWVRTSALQIT